MRRSAGLAVVGALVAAAACAADDPCPSTAQAGGDFRLTDGTPGVYVVEISWLTAHLVAGFVIAVAEPVPALPREAFAFVAPDRWLRLSTSFAGTRTVQECRRGGTPEGDCDEIGPPREGRMVVYRDGVQTLEMPLYAPSFPVEPVVAGCPLLFAGHVD